MKKILILALAMVVAGAHAQRTVEKNETTSKDETIFLQFKFANDITVSQWDKNEVAVKADVTIDDGEGDSYFSLQTDKASDMLKIYSDFGDYYKQKNKDKNYWEKRCNTETTINYTIYVPKGSTLKVKSISGDLVVNSFQGNLRTDLVSGDVTLKDYDGELRRKTVSGDLDVTMDNAEIDAKTVTGTIYSDLDIKRDESKRRSSGQNRVRGTVNGGSDMTVLSTVSGNIYMRKG